MHVEHDVAGDPPQSCTLVLSFGLFVYIGDAKVLDGDLGKDHVLYGAVRQFSPASCLKPEVLLYECLLALCNRH
jgi:hypothetical protein